MLRRMLLATTAMILTMGVAITDDKADMKVLQGTWLVIDADVEGKKVGESFKGLELVLSGSNYSVKVQGDTDKGTFTINTKKTPHEMDISGGEGPNRGKTYPCLYEVKDDTLTVCYGLDFKTRPTELKAPEKSGRMLIVYKKKK
jgi:uncharacterized protein (TIGR03067 family)